MKLNKIIETIENFAPLTLAESWDNVGLLIGNKDFEVESVVICLDVTDKAYNMCIESNAKLCICHHPFIFDAIKKMDFANPYYELLRKFISSDIAVYSAHTNLDSCVGGVNDALGPILGLEIKSTFMPIDPNEKLLKTVVPGIGRICEPCKETSLFDFYKTVLENLKTPGCHINFDTDRQIRKILVTGGSYDSDWNSEVLEKNIDVIVSGEIKHHDMVFFERYGVATLSAGHDTTERVILSVFADYLKLKLDEIRFAVCQSFDYNKVVF